MDPETDPLERGILIVAEGIFNCRWTAITLAVTKVLHGLIEQGAVIAEHPHGQHRLDHGGLPVAVGSGIKILDSGIEDLPKHLLKALLICFQAPGGGVSELPMLGLFLTPRTTLAHGFGG